MARILNFDDVCWAPEAAQTSGIAGMTFALASSQLAIISAPPAAGLPPSADIASGLTPIADISSGLPPIADIASGLLEPASGSVKFRDQTWPSMSPYQASRNRGSIGRIFEENRWVSNLSVMDNLILQQRHHSPRSQQELQSEAAALAKQVGFPVIPVGRPEDVRPVDLRRLQWVRAFLGSPQLILMEQPESGLSGDHLAPLTHLIKTALTRGTSVLWITTEATPGADIRRPGVIRFRMESGKMAAVAEAT